MRTQAVWTSLLASLLLTSVASAQESTGFSSNRYVPAPRGSEWFAGDTLDLRGHGHYALGGTLDFGHAPLTVEYPDGSSAVLLQNQLYLHLGGSVTLWDRVRLDTNIPVALWQDGEQAVIDGVVYDPPSGAAFGDIRLGGDVRLFGRFRDPLTIAAGVRLWLPTGSSNQYTSDGTTRFDVHLSAAGELSIFSYSGQLGVMYRDSSDYGQVPLGTEMPFVLTAGARLFDGQLVVGPELMGSTTLVDGAAFMSETTNFELLFGGHYTHASWRWGAAMGPGLSSGLGTPEYRALLSAEFVPALVEDRDGDGFDDEHDACPGEAGGRSPAGLGCPMPKDTDGDGVEDRLDECPRRSSVERPDPERPGCPAAPDADEDGIDDAHDACPQEAGVKHDDSERNGCPLSLDADNDGIEDDADSCPAEAGVASEDKTKNGCPLPPDRDGDGVSDARDQCPDVAGSGTETEGEKLGCPQAVIEGDHVDLSGTVEFNHGSSQLAESSSRLLMDVARVIQTLPEGSTVTVEGHTDSVGLRSINLTLSRERAEAVVDWLVEDGGISRERLRAVGLADTRPLVPNTSDENRAKNRRVEFHVE